MIYSSSKAEAASFPIGTEIRNLVRRGKTDFYGASVCQGRPATNYEFSNLTIDDFQDSRRNGVKIASRLKVLRYFSSIE